MIFFLTSRFNIRFFLCILRWSIAADPWVIAASSCWNEPVTFCCGCRRRIAPSAAVRGLPCWVRTKWMGYNGKSYSNGRFGGTPILGNAHFWTNPSGCLKWISADPFYYSVPGGEVRNLDPFSEGSSFPVSSLHLQLRGARNLHLSCWSLLMHFFGVIFLCSMLIVHDFWTHLPPTPMTKLCIWRYPLEIGLNSLYSKWFNITFSNFWTFLQAVFTASPWSPWRKRPRLPGCAELCRAPMFCNDATVAAVASEVVAGTVATTTGGWWAKDGDEREILREFGYKWYILMMMMMMMMINEWMNEWMNK